METVNITTLSLEQLKAMAYDNVVNMEVAERNIQAIKIEIEKRKKEIK